MDYALTHESDELLSLRSEDPDMLYALNLPNGGNWSDPHTLAELAQLAEETGWNGVFVEDYIVWQSQQNVPTYDPWISLAAMAMRTNHVRLGTNVTPLARRRPWKVAREAVTLDHLSNGRFILAVGLGDTGESVESDISFTNFGEVTDAKQRAQRLDEALDVIVGLWSGEPFHYDGKYFQVKDVKFVPRPIQTPRIPIWVGGGWPLKGPTQRAARWDGARLYKHRAGSMTPMDIRALQAVVQKQRGSLEGYDIVVSINRRNPNMDEQRTHLRSLAEAGATWCAEYLSPNLGNLEIVRAHIARGPLRID
jgi:alkanesulfonate monooxygenase SsuD/methylene tetrahydromethanopterin reductase-like flavin-dependent oxidoreductase (luciferase family)